VTAIALATPLVTAPLVTAARNLAERHLTGARLLHTAGVAAAAGRLAGALTDVPAPTRDDECQLLVAAAWLHDIGYCDAAVDTGFHPIDGARMLAGLGWSERMSALVAHHSGARFVAEPKGLGALLARYPDECSALSEALTYADQVTGAHGQPLPMVDRMADMLRRHGPTSINAVVHHRRGPYLLAIADRVEARLRSAEQPTRLSLSGRLLAAAVDTALLQRAMGGEDTA
jgi:HD domain